MPVLRSGGLVFVMALRAFYFQGDMVRKITFLLFSGLFFVGLAGADTYPGVLFDNSIMRGSYAHSHVNYQGSSWVENVQCHLPVSDTLFFTPGNALSLKYTSGEHAGFWQTDLFFPRVAGNYQTNDQEVLSLKLFVLTPETGEVNLPAISLVYGEGESSAQVDLARYVTNYATNVWLNVKIPVTDFGSAWREAAVEGVRLAQNLRDRGSHHVFVDQVEFLPRNPPSEKLFSAAVLTAATPYDRHVKLTWELPMTPSIRYIKIYRSEDNETFEPVGIEPVFVRNAVDFVPVSNKTYYYKIAWADYNYAESPFSDVKEAATKTASDEELLDFIQETHINYFLENVEVNSGMHMLSRRVGDPRVSVKHTGLSLLAQIVGVERGFVSRNLVASRTLRTLRFLQEAEQHLGVFPTWLNGRTGKGIYRVDSLASVDVVATSYLLQGLLVAKQYFDGENKEETALRGKIDSLYANVNWEEFIGMDENAPFLFDSWSPTRGFADAKPLGGFNESMVSYLLALGSPTFPIPTESYVSGMGFYRELADSVATYHLELTNNSFFSAELGEVEEQVAETTSSELDEPLEETRSERYFVRTPLAKDTLFYGLPVSAGSIDESPMAAVLPFLAFDPRHKADTFANYFDNNHNLLQAYKRRDNEVQADDFSLDIWGGLYRADSLGLQTYVVNPAISISSYAYRSKDALKSAREFYDRYGEYMFTGYGFRPWINPKSNTVSERFDAESQAAVAVLIENGRSGLIWDLLSRDEHIARVIDRFFVVTGPQEGEED